MTPQEIIAAIDDALNYGGASEMCNALILARNYISEDAQNG